MFTRCFLALFALALAAGAVIGAADLKPAAVVINEIHFDPPEKRPVEFIELHNPGVAPVSLGGWTLEKFVFPAGATLAAGGYAVVAVEPAAFEKDFGFKPYGPLPGKLSNRGEKLTLSDAAGQVMDQVKYGAGFPWPTAAAGGGPSLERIHSTLPGDNPASWRSAGYAMAAPRTGVVFIPAEDSRWRWRKGTNEASELRAAWRQRDFVEDASWQTGRTSIGYGDDDDRTVLDDMRGRYTCLFLRHSFVVVKEKSPPALLLRVRVDDGCIVWLNGREVARLHMAPEDLPFNAVAGSHEAGEEFEEVFLSAMAKLLVPGTNLLAVQACNAARDSSDLTIDLELRTPEGSAGGKRPTPGAQNSVFTTNAPPGVTELAQQPAQPKSGEPVLITARVGDADGVRTVTLQTQTVEPGNYISKSEAAYESVWRDFPMHDDGADGDTRAGDGVFSATLPADLQRHRRLVRYRVTASDQAGLVVRVPYPDDSCPNFAYFVYDGVPAWTGASQPGRTPPRTFSPEFLTTLPVYHLLAKSGEVARSQWDGGGNRRPFRGTLVYEERVYDHIEFHNRGMGSTHISGKNKWGFKFNRTHDFEARDNSGQRYGDGWDSVNLNPGLSTPYLPVHCGIAGLDEAVSFRAFQLAGVPAPNTHWVQFRVIDRVAESAPSQYAGDLWGLYLAVQDLDGAWLRERGLADGNIYSTQSGRKHLGRGQPADNSDWHPFLGGVRGEHPEPWWRTNLDLPAYYGFHAINRVVANVDLRPDGNHGYYHRPDGRWTPLPWDLDMMLVPRTHQPGFIDAVRSLKVPALKIEFQNRARDILDLFCADASPDGGQIGQLVAELSRVLMPAGFTNNWGQLDEAVWNWNPHNNQKGQFYVNPATGNHFGGPWKRTLATPDLAGFCRYIVEFCTDSRPARNYAPNDGDQRGYGYGHLWSESKDDRIPARPTVRYAGPPGFPAKNLRFQITPFDDPQGSNSFAAVQWRIGEIGAPGQAGAKPARPRRYEIEPHWASEALLTPAPEIRPPGSACVAGHTYRVRARYQDNTKRWGHWSAPVEFVAGRE